MLVGIVTAVKDVVMLVVKKKCLSVVPFNCTGCDGGTTYGSDSEGNLVELLGCDDISWH